MPAAAGDDALSGDARAGSGSSDIDGTISTYAWTFGDGVTGTGATPSHTYSTGGKRSADLVWSGAIGANVDVYRNGVYRTATANDGAYTDNVGRASGTFTYKVCNAGTASCSNQASVSF